MKEQEQTVSVGSDAVVVLRVSSANALLKSIEELRRHMHEPHGGGGYPCEDTVSREKKMMFHHANRDLDTAIAEVRRQMEVTTVRQPQDNDASETRRGRTLEPKDGQ